MPRAPYNLRSTSRSVNDASISKYTGIVDVEDSPTPTLSLDKYGNPLEHVDGTPLNRTEYLQCVDDFIRNVSAQAEGIALTLPYDTETESESESESDDPRDEDYVQAADSGTDSADDFDQDDDHFVPEFSGQLRWSSGNATQPSPAAAAAAAAATPPRHKSMKVKIPLAPRKTARSTPLVNSRLSKRLFAKNVVDEDSDDDDDESYHPDKNDEVQEREDADLDAEFMDRFTFEKDIKAAREYITEEGGHWRDTCLPEYVRKYKDGDLEYSDLAWAMKVSGAMDEAEIIHKQSPISPARVLATYFKRMEVEVYDDDVTPDSVTFTTDEWDALTFNHPKYCALVENCLRTDHLPNGTIEVYLNDEYA